MLNGWNRLSESGKHMPVLANEINEIKRKCSLLFFTLREMDILSKHQKWTSEFSEIRTLRSALTRVELRTAKMYSIENPLPILVPEA